MKLDILAFGAHPDDVELGCAATLAKEISLGRKVGVVDLTRGELGTRGSAEIRDREAARAADILGLSMRKNMGFADGFFLNDKKHQMALIKVIRTYRPKVVFANALRDRHIDHGKGAQLVSDACFLSGLRKIETQSEQGSPQEAWRPEVVYHYIQWENLKPDLVVDVSGFLNLKMEAVQAYASQFYDPQSKEPTSPISSENFLESVRYRAQDLGRLIGKDHAEGFNVERLPAVNSIMDLK